MIRNLFLEGTIQSGKSTLLRKMLQPYMDRIGGFASQRLLDDSGCTVGYRIGQASTTPLTTHFSKDYSGIFRITDKDGEVHKYPEAFDREGIKYLTENQGKKLILLDEIGGAEMLNPLFRHALHDVLSGSTPCIGVIKLEESAAHMSRTAKYDESVLKFNRQLRQLVTEQYDGKILRYDRNNNNIVNEIEEFLCGIFTTK